MPLPTSPIFPSRWMCISRLFPQSLGLVLCLLGHWCQADTLWMKNGDRLSGSIRLLDGGKLTIDTDYGGAISVQWDQVATLKSDQRLLLKKKGEYEAEQCQSLESAEQGKVVVQGAGGRETVALAEIHQVMKPKPVVKDFLSKGNIDANFKFEQVESESDTNTYDLLGNSEIRSGRWRHTTKGEYHRETVNDLLTTGNWKLSGAPDYFITDRWFWQGRLDYQRDKLEEIPRQWTLGSGPGYQFWDNELGAFYLVGLLNQSRFHYSDGARSNFNTLAIKWRYSRLLMGQSFELFTDGELGRPTDNEFDYFLNGQLGLRYRLNSWLALNVRTERERVKGNLRGELDDTRYFFGVGVFW